MTKQAHFTPEFFKFLNQLKRHNNREWFLANKHRYEGRRSRPVSEIHRRLSAASAQDQSALYRRPAAAVADRCCAFIATCAFVLMAILIKQWRRRAFRMSPGSKATAPGFYLHLESGTSFLACGLWHPDPETRNTSQRGNRQKSRAMEEDCERQEIQSRCANCQAR